MVVDGGEALLEEAARRRWVEGRLAELWSAWGYREVVPPAWLPWEEVGFGTAGLPAQACKFLDPLGRVLSLRPDNTIPIARLAATDLAGQPRPLRLLYRTEVYRRRKGGEAAALPQSGLELIGGASPQADAEVLALAAESLRTLGLEDFRIAVGHVGLLAATLEEAGVTAEARRRVMAALADRNYVALEAALTGIPSLAAAERADLLRRLTVPVPAGAGPAGAPAPDGDGRMAPWRNLSEVLALLDLYGLRDHVVIEPGLVRDLEYYTGLVFEIAAPGLARPLGGGGRYDGLLSWFGTDEPATGFAFEVRELARALADRGRDPAARRPVLVVARDGAAPAAWERARGIRAAGGVAEVDLGRRPLEESLAYARRRGCRAVVAVSARGEEEIPL